MGIKTTEDETPCNNENPNINPINILGREDGSPVSCIVLKNINQIKTPGMATNPTPIPDISALGNL